MLTGTLITAAGFTPVDSRNQARWRIHVFLSSPSSPSHCWCPGLSPSSLRPISATSCSIRKTRREGSGPCRCLRNPVLPACQRTGRWCVRRRWVVIAATLAAFVLSLVAFNTGVQNNSSQRRAARTAGRPVAAPGAHRCGRPRRRRRRSNGCWSRTRRWREVGKYFADYIGNGSPRFYFTARPATVQRQLCPVRRHHAEH